MNTKLLLKVKAAILAEPTKFRMAWWFQEEMGSPCGTSACIAGHAIAIGRQWRSLKPGFNLLFRSNINDVAEQLLEIDPEQSLRLFGAFCWPDPFETKYYAAKSARTRAKVAARRIDHFIATNGAE